ncbi:MAG: hypothetical protein ABJJ53_02370 [Sulfitobacter sp.]
MSHLLRVGIVLMCLVVLSGIVPISLAHFQTGNACPNLGPIPACYVVSVCYAAIGLAALVWWRNLAWLFFAGITPVIVLAAIGTSLELAGRPTCPLSDEGLPLCYVSLAMGCSLLLAFLGIQFFEKKKSK